MIAKCTTCGRPAEPTARYCPYCYTVFPSDMPARARLAVGPDRQPRSRGWALAVLFVLFVGGFWFSQIDADDWTTEDGSFGSAARDMKRMVAGAAWRLKSSITGEAAEQAGGLRIARSAVKRSGGECIIAQAVANPSPTQVSPIILAFTFKGPDGSTIGKTVSSSVPEALPPGASRTVTLEMPCPEVFANAEVKPVEKALVLSAPPAVATASGGEEMSWSLNLDSPPPCPNGSCKVVIRFRSGASAVYQLEQRRLGGARLRATDKKGSELLKMAQSAILIVRTPGDRGWSLPIARDGDDQWSVAGAARISADAGRSAADGKGL